MKIYLKIIFLQEINGSLMIRSKLKETFLHLCLDGFIMDKTQFGQIQRTCLLLVGFKFEKYSTYHSYTSDYPMNLIVSSDHFVNFNSSVDTKYWTGIYEKVPNVVLNGRPMWIDSDLTSVIVFGGKEKMRFWLRKQPNKS